MPSPALFLFSGILLSVLGFPRNPERRSSFKKGGTRLLQLSIVLLGAKIPMGQLWEAGRTGLVLSLMSVVLVLAAGWLLQRLFRMEGTQAALISSGTAICGGSAIAAVAPTIRAKNVDVGVAIAVVFLLNAVSMMIFPPIGRWMELSDRQFAVWAALAIHDTSSVVGAGAAWSQQALEWATTIKLSRTLWIFPLVLFFSLVRKRNAGEPKVRIPIPWFIGGFLLASLLSSFFPSDEVKFLARASVQGFGISLFLIGASISRDQLVKAGMRPLLYGVVLWGLTLVGALAWVKAFL